MEYEKRVRQKLTEYGCYFTWHGKGDHIFPVDGEIKSRHLANKIMKQAGIDHHF
jgi:TPP-dependent indolepyruvate ferredoxin oxidoreductase alpha subunit